MKSILAYIMQHKRAYRRLPLFEHMRDEQRDALERLAFYPGMAHFILSFADINKYMLRYDQATTELEQMVNVHTFEDDHHWPWYLEDLAKLGFDVNGSGSDWMRLLWSDELRFNRILTYRLASLIDVADAVERIVIIEAIEETGNVLFTEIAKLAQELEPRLGTELRYCGDFHFSRESGHAVGSDHRVLVQLELDEAKQAHCRTLVDRIFALFAAWTDELLAYALAHPIRDGVPLRRGDGGIAA